MLQPPNVSINVTAANIRIVDSPIRFDCAARRFEPFLQHLGFQQP